MSKYTTQVRFICENAAGLTESVGLSKVDTVIQQAIPNIFDFDFPIWDTDYKNVLCTKILRHYYTREIGSETVGLWKFRLNTKLNEIMPKYNKLYSLAQHEFYNNVDLTTERHGDTKGDDTTTDSGSGGSTTTSDTTISDTGKSKVAVSETPQGSLQDLESLTYLSQGTVSDVNNTQNNISDVNVNTHNSNTSDKKYTSTEDWLEHLAGKNGGESYGDMFFKFVEQYKDIDTMIIDELNDLFMLIY